MRMEAGVLFSFPFRGRRADPWVGLGRGKPRPYIRDIKGEALGQLAPEGRQKLIPEIPLTRSLRTIRAMWVIAHIAKSAMYAPPGKVG
jgi:hypothetical protein